ncbi:MAG: transcriptional regulator [Bacteroidia bacterium]|jgi:transcriptional regulator
MYNLPYYKENNAQVIKEFIDIHPFAFITGCNSENKPIATQIPMFMEERDGKKVLRGHIMKNTDHHLAFEDNPNALVVFSGPNTYVSGTWYSNPNTPSTYNYMSVYISGTIRLLDDKDLIDVLRMTTLHFENNNKASATIYDNLPPTMTEKLRQAIVAFEIEVEEMDAVFKLSQDRDAVSYRNIISKLSEQNEDGREIAAEMEMRMDQVFPKSI